MANICSNKLYCSTDIDTNYQYIRNWLYNNFHIENLNSEIDENKNSMDGEFFSKWNFPEKMFNALTKELTGDNSLFIRVISFEPGNLYLEGNVYQDGCWRQF